MGNSQMWVIPQLRFVLQCSNQPALQMGKLGPRDHVLCAPGLSLAPRGWGAQGFQGTLGLEFPHPVGTGVLWGEPCRVDCLPPLGSGDLSQGWHCSPHTPSVAGPQAARAEYIPTLPPAPDPVEDLCPGIVPWGLGTVPGRRAVDPHGGHQPSPPPSPPPTPVSLNLSFWSHDVAGPHPICCNLHKSWMTLRHQTPPGPEPGGRAWQAEGLGFLGIDGPRHRSELLCRGKGTKRVRP